MALTYYLLVNKSNNLNAFLIVPLPETVGKPMKETIKEAIQYE